MSAAIPEDARSQGRRRVILQERPVWLTWALLVAATVVTAWVLSIGSGDPRWGPVLVLALAAWKVRLVLTDFIELRDAPLLGRVIVEGWAVLLPITLVVLTWRG